MLSVQTTNKRLGDERGVGLVELLIIVALVVIITGFAAMRITSARTSMRLQNSARQLAANLERARLDAIRGRHYVNVDFKSPTTYEIQMDFNGDGTVGATEISSYSLESGVVLTKEDGTEFPSTASADSFPGVDFEWRGRTTECSTLFKLKNTRNEQSVIQVAGSGDITINNAVTTLPTVSATTVSSTTDIKASAVVAVGSDTPPYQKCGTASGGGGGTPAGPSEDPPPPCTGPGGTFNMTTSQKISIKRNGATTGTTTLTTTGTGPVTIESVNSNLKATLTSQSVTSSGGTYNYSIVSVTKTTSGSIPFVVKFRFSTCVQTLYVTVTR